MLHKIKFVVTEALQIIILTFAGMYFYLETNSLFLYIIGWIFIFIAMIKLRTLFYYIFGPLLAEF